jgi:hypothetical protein
MTAYLSPVGNDQFVDVNGNPLTGGKVYTYLAGTSTPADTWATSAGDVAQPNPIVLNSLGATFNPIWLTADVAYKIVIKDSLGVSTLYTFDNITGINDPAYSLLSEWVLFASAPTYIASTIFSVAADQTIIFQPGRRVKTINSGGTVYSTIQTSVFATGVTTITVLNDSGALDSGLSAVYYGFLSASNPAIPDSSFGIAQTPYRNAVINGDFALDQRNGGATQNFTANILSWCADMFYMIGTGAAPAGRCLIQPDASYRYNVFGSNGNTTNILGTRIESSNCIHMAGHAATISFKTSTTTPTSLAWAAYYANSTNAFGTPGAYTRTLIANGTFSITSTEQTYSTVLNIPADAYKGLEIVFTHGALPNGSTWIMGDVQLEKGAVTTSNIQFERVDIGLKTLRCQRYQFLINDYFGQVSTTGNVYDGKITFPVEMRSTPEFDGSVIAPSFVVSSGSAGTPALFTDATILTSRKSALCYNVTNNWTIGVNVRLSALLACNIP